MINQNLNPKYSKETTISRQARSAFLISIIFAVAASINLVVTIRLALATRAWTSFVDVIVVFIFLAALLKSVAQIRGGQKENGVWLVLISFVITIALRNMLNEGMGILFGVLTIIFVPLLGLLTLKPESFNKTLALGFASGAFYVSFDILAQRFLPYYRQSAENVAPLVTSVMILGIIVTVIFIATLFQQNRYLLLSSKLILSMVSIVLVPLIILSFVSISTLQETLKPRQEETMEEKALSLSRIIGYFVHADKNTVRAEAQTPILAAYLTAPQSQTSELRDEALETLRSFKRRNILYIRSYAILDESGINILDTMPTNIDQNEYDTSYFTHSFETGTFYISDISRNNAEENFSFYISAPILAPSGEMLGVLRAEYDIEILQGFVKSYARNENVVDKDIFAAVLFPIPLEGDFDASSEEPSSAYLILANSKDPVTLNFHSITPLSDSATTYLQETFFLAGNKDLTVAEEFPGLDAGIRTRAETSVFQARAFPRVSSGTTPLDLIASVDVENVDDDQMPEWVVLASQDLKSVYEPLQEQRATLTLITLTIFVGGILLAYTGSRYLLQPIKNLTDVVETIAGGDHSARAPINSEDEIGSLSQAFNSMTGQLQGMVNTLEERVSDRTKDLERRSQQLQAAVEVGKVAVSLRDLDNLLAQASELISLRFGFYHVGMFLLDKKEEYAVLRASNSDGGKRMLERNHQLKVGQVGIVGYVTETGQARIALDVGQDAVYFDNPDLPETRSEMALALIAGGRILGALDIQSTQGEAFSDADITTLQVLADQIAISIENARLFEENRTNLQALRRAYGEQSRLGWQELTYTRAQYGYQSKSDGSILPIDKPRELTSLETVAENKTVLDETKSTASIPIIVRGHPIGMLRLAKPETALSWTETELELANTLSNELSGALDSARLFDETRKQAEQEYIVGEITDKMRETMNVESIIKMATDEIYKLLDLDHIAIRFTPMDDENEQSEGAA